MLIILPTSTDDEAPSKAAKVEIPSSHVGVVSGQLGMTYPPQSTLGVGPPMYVFFETISVFKNFFCFILELLRVFFVAELKGFYTVWPLFCCTYAIYFISYRKLALNIFLC